MNPEALHTSLIETLSLTLVITSVAAVEMRRLKFSIVAYLCQALLIVGLLLSFAAVNQRSLLVGGHRPGHQGDPYTLVPFPGDPRCG